MNIEIDQSGKIEDTSKNTVVAFSNSKSGSIFISARDKREIQNFFREIGKPRVFIYKTFAILIFLLIKDDLKKINWIIIDEEYPGKENLIKNYLIQEIRKAQLGFRSDNILFKQIGKKSKAHSVGYLTYAGKISPTKKIKARELLKILFK